MSISAKERREIPDSKMGVPGKDKYPLDTKEHIKSASHLINKGKITEDERETLAKKILRRAKEEGMNTDSMHAVKQVAAQQEQVPPMSDGTSLGNAPPRTMAPYYDEAGEQLAQRLAATSSQMSGVTPTAEEDELMARMNQIGVAHAEAIGKRDMKAEPFLFAQKIVKEISAQVEKDSKPPTGNQNCELCTWCAEARYRGINALPRPIYSPRDPALPGNGHHHGEDIVMNPIKESFISQKDVIKKVRGNVDSRWYVHVNWKDSTGGHEFLVVNINDYAYLLDAQAGLLKELDESDSTHNYFRDINFKNSYMVRLDTRKFNAKLFNEMNDPSKVVPWKNSIDIPYMRDHGMLAPGDDDDPRFRRVLVPSDEGLKYLKEDPELSQYWEDMHKATKGEFLVNRETGEAIGHVFVHTNKKDLGFIFNLEVTPSYRRQGYGWILIDDAVRRFEGVDLTVRCDNEPAVHLYLDYGFEIYKKGVWFDPPHEEYWMKLKKELIPKPVQEGAVGKVIVGGIVIFALINLVIAIKDSIKNHQYEKKTPADEKLLTSIEKFLSRFDNIDQYLDELTSKNYEYYDYIRDGMDTNNTHLRQIIKYTSECINSKSNCYQSNEKLFVEFFEKCKEYTETLWDLLCKLDDHLGDAIEDFHDKSIDDVAMRYRKQYRTTFEHLIKLIDKFLKALQKSTGTKNVVQESSNVFESGHFDKYKDMLLGFNDDGMAVMKNCDCGGKISITMNGEPIYKCESCGKTYGCVPFQEGAIQDLKNGVNPYSDNMVFHVTPEKHADGQVWKPRVPDYLDPYNPEDTGFEDNTTPRICFSTSIEGCLNGITVNLPRQNPDQFDKLYVYIPEKPWKEYKHKTNKELVKDKLVYDANVTREVWIMEPVRMKLYGVIRVDQVSNVKRKSVVPTSKGEKGDRNYFTYKWHWVVKPKVLAKGTKFDYSPERVIDDLCIDLKKFKYGLIRNGKLQTGNVSESDYNKYWVFHSGQEVDEAGGGNCYDMVEYEAGYLEAFGAAYKKYFMSFTDKKNKMLGTHTICVVPLNGKYVYIEQAFKRVTDEWGYERQKTFDKLNDIFDYVAECMADYERQSGNFGVWDYTSTKIDYGTPIKEFMQTIMSGKMIYDGEAGEVKQESFVIPARFSGK